MNIVELQPMSTLEALKEINVRCDLLRRRASNLASCNLPLLDEIQAFTAQARSNAEKQESDLKDWVEKYGAARDDLREIAQEVNALRAQRHEAVKALRRVADRQFNAMNIADAALERIAEFERATCTGIVHPDLQAEGHQGTPCTCPQCFGRAEKS